MIVFDVNAPPATLLKAVIKHIINLPALNSFPLSKMQPCKAPLSKRNKKVISFLQLQLHFLMLLILLMALIFISSCDCAFLVLSEHLFNI